MTYRQSNWLKTGIAVALVVLLVGGCGGCVLYRSYATKEAVTIHVKDKERTGGDNGKYLVYTDGEVFEDVDAWLNAKTNSSDIYSGLEPGHTYHCTVNGWRFSPFSWYRNILHCEGVADG